MSLPLPADPNKPDLLILAAGMGSRYGGLKQLEAFGPNGELILDYSVHDAVQAGFGRLVFVIRRDIEALFREKVGERYTDRLPVEYVFQDDIAHLPYGFAPPAGRTRPWGTGHAVWCARDTIDRPFAVLNADDFYGRDGFHQLARFFAENDGSLHRIRLVAFRLANTLSDHGTVSRGICAVQEDRLCKVEEVKQIGWNNGKLTGVDGDGRMREFTGEEPVSMNLWGFTPAFFSVLERGFTQFVEVNGGDLKAEYYLPEAVDRLIGEPGWQVEAGVSGDEWVGVTHSADREPVRAFFRQQVERGHYPSPLWAA